MPKEETEVLRDVLVDARFLTGGSEMASRVTIAPVAIREAWLVERLADEFASASEVSEAVADFKRKCQSCATISSSLPGPNGAKSINRESIYDHAADWWLRRSPTENQRRFVSGFSRVGFSSSKDVALLYLGRGDSGYFILFRRGGDRWQFLDQVIDFQRG
jgi:hypothetical protein